MARIIDAFEQFFDNAGDPLSNGSIEFFKSGTSSPLATFADSLMTIQNANPLPLVVSGRPENAVFAEGSAKALLRDSLGTLIKEVDPIGGENVTGPYALFDSQITYGLGGDNIVTGSDGKYYVSTSAGNQGNDPITPSPTKWSEFVLRGIYNASETYSIGNVVQETTGNLWRSLTNSNTGNTPSTDSGTNWVPAVDGSKISEVEVLEDLNVWKEKAIDFTMVVRESNSIDGSGGAIDASLPSTLTVGDVFTAHNEVISTNTVLIKNPLYTIKGPAGSISAGTDMELDPGDTAKLVAVTTLILEVV